MLNLKQYNYTFNCPIDGECKPYSISLPQGLYKLEAWGASGGYVDENYAGKGGYAQGILTLTHNVQVYIFVGQKGCTSSTAVKSCKAWNGGGSCDPGDSSNSICGGGGGATDFRINSEELEYRVLIAGGGGGSAKSVSVNRATYGGAGGGYVGTNGETISQGTGGVGASQINNNHWGIGEDADQDACGGGGGYFGGTGGYAHNSGGGGGSGFAFVESNAEDAKNNGILLDKQYYLSNAILIRGDHYMPHPTSSTQSIGHLNDGYARITQIGSIFDNCKSIKQFFLTLQDACLLLTSIFVLKK